MDWLEKPFNRVHHIETKESCISPFPRSGHRSVANHSAVFVFGGYHGDGHKLFRETMCYKKYKFADRKVSHLDAINEYNLQQVWKFDIHREEWELLLCTGDPPTSVASSSVLMSGDLIITFGGSGVPFGYTNSNDIHVVSVKTKHWSSLNCKGDVPEPKYGTSAALTRDGQIVLFGGTSGSLFNSDVHFLDLKTRSFRQENAKGAPKPRYRHEVVWDDERFYTIGGCTLQEDFSFDLVHSFEYETLTWQSHHCSPSSSDGVPSPRRFHSCAKYENNVYMCGGTTFLDHIYNDFWKLDLTNFQWTKLWQTLPTPVFFHSTAFTPAGSLYIFGGCMSLMTTERSNQIFKVWLFVPKMSELCWTQLLKTFPKIKCLPANSLLHLGVPPVFAQRLNTTTTTAAS